MGLHRRHLLALAAATAGVGLTGPARAQTVIEAPIRLEGGRVLIDVTLNGAGPHPFAVDTGAELSGIRLALAEQLRLPELRRVRLGGGQFPFFGVDELILGGAVRQTDAGLFGLEGDRLGAEGLIAAGMLTSVDSELLFEAGVWRLHPAGAPDRTGFSHLENGTIEAARQNGLSSRLFGSVQINGRPERVVLDTGGPRPLTISRDRAEDLGLWDDARPWAPYLQSNIRGASSEPSRLVRLERLNFGGQTYDNILVGLNAGQNIGGETILGLPVLRTLDLSIASSDRTIWVRRNGLTPDSPGYGLSGVWLDDAPGGARVAAVGTGSPAAAAGVRVGDRVVGAGTFREALDRFRGEPGQQVQVELRRDGQVVEAAFTLAAYL